MIILDETPQKDDFMREFCIDPGESNYPREPDVPAGVYFICVECSRIDRATSLSGSEENK